MRKEDRIEWRWEIVSGKQDNGLWGMPLNCVYIDKVVMLGSWEEEVRRSAIYIAIMEAYGSEEFEVHYSSEVGFLCTLSRTGPKYIKFEDYRLEGGVLIWIGGELISKELAAE